MTVLKRMLVLVVLACLVMTLFPVSASAVDPVSAATMANALAQAITAYGASQGVSMSFDVTNTDGIGEGVKELWDNFKADMESDPDYSGPAIQTYDTMSVGTWAKLYKKIGDKVGIDLTAEVKSAFDGFWNWLLSGPAEMTKVDNQYFQWTLNENDTVTPIIVGDYQNYYLNGNRVVFINSTLTWTANNRNCYIDSTVPCFAYRKDGALTLLARSEGSVQYADSNGNVGSKTFGKPYNYLKAGWYAAWPCGYGVDPYNIPNYNVFLTPSSENYLTTDGDLINVQPYVGDTVPQDVYIPDNQDVNYQPVPVAIPLDINWDDSIYGDGTDTLTDAQAQEIADALDTAITENPAKTLELADTDTPIPEPGEVYIPFLPVELPSFNFNFSGIWHYVVEWISSLGAWFSMVLTVWNNLPYAMTVPVYACLVILIVLGVYRRFLS